MNCCGMWSMMTIWQINGFLFEAMVHTPPNDFTPLCSVTCKFLRPLPGYGRLNACFGLNASLGCLLLIGWTQESCFRDGIFMFPRMLSVCCVVMISVRQEIIYSSIVPLPHNAGRCWILFVMRAQIFMNESRKLISCRQMSSLWTLFRLQLGSFGNSECHHYQCWAQMPSTLEASSQRAISPSILAI